MTAFTIISCVTAATGARPVLRQVDRRLPSGPRVHYRHILPPTVQYAVLPPEIVTTLSPLPPGYVYVRTGADVYVMNRTDRTIMDAVALMSDLR